MNGVIPVKRLTLAEFKAEFPSPQTPEVAIKEALKGIGMKATNRRTVRKEAKEFRIGSVITPEGVIQTITGGRYLQIPCGAIFNLNKDRRSVKERKRARREERCQAQPQSNNA